jgi:hypothetical protein
MATSPAFDRTCDELERRTTLDRLAARGTVRLGLKSAGLDAASVNAAQMGVVLRRVLPAELAARGVTDVESVCASIADALAEIVNDVTLDRAAQAAATVARFGT